MAISAHRRVLLLPLLLAAVSLQQATGQAPGDPCFTNLTEIMLLQATLDPLADKVFTLCPNTIFDIGFPSSGGACCFDGQHPLVARQNTRFQCGETGASSNNCILRGGRSQFLSAPELLNEDNSRVQVAGLSFESATFFTAVLGNAGSITFSDCVWRNNKNDGPVFVVYFFPETRRRLQLELTGDVFQDAERVVEYALQQQQDVGEGSGLLSEAEENGEEAASRNANETARHLQQAERKRQVLVFEDNLFEGNIQGDDGGPGIQCGIISILSPDNDVTVRNSIFRNNLYGDENVEVDGYAITNRSPPSDGPGSTLTLENNCFVDNDFIGLGAVQAFAGTPFNSTGNYGTRMDDDLICQYAAVSDLQFPTTPENVTCEAFESDTCSLDLTTPAPSMAPSPTSLAPSAGEEAPSARTSAPSSASSPSAPTPSAATRTVPNAFRLCSTLVVLIAVQVAALL